NLIYTPDAQGNCIPDFANVGYRQGLVPLPGSEGAPDVPTRVTLDPAPGDAGARIQAAIDQVSPPPLDADGYRGAILLHAGESDIHDPPVIRARGVAVRGPGPGTTGTILRATGTSHCALVQFESFGHPVQPRSLYYQQLGEYLAHPGLDQSGSRRLCPRRHLRQSELRHR